VVIKVALQMFLCQASSYAGVSTEAKSSRTSRQNSRQKCHTKVANKLRLQSSRQNNGHGGASTMPYIPNGTKDILLYYYNLLVDDFMHVVW
jgi:hypothetical protein